MLRVMQEGREGVTEGWSTTLYERLGRAARAGTHEAIALVTLSVFFLALLTPRALRENFAFSFPSDLD